MTGKTILEGNEIGLNETPEELKIFNTEHTEYVYALVANVLLNDTKGKLLNIIEGIGMPDKQEKAIKRSVTNALHETVHDIKECMVLVTDIESL